MATAAMAAAISGGGETSAAVCATAPSRNEFLDYAKGLLIFLVAWGHVIQFAGYARGGFWSDPVFQAIYMFHMPLFMAVSGYLAHRGITCDGWGPLLRRRTVQLLAPILAWGLIAVAVRFGREVAASDMALGDMLSRVGGLLARGIIGNYWFLWALLFATVIVATLRRCRLDTALGLALACMAVLFIPNARSVYLWKYVFPFFCLGYLAARHGVPACLRTRWALAAAAALTVVAFVLWTRDSYVYVSRMALADGGAWHIAFRFASGAVVSFLVLRLAHAAYRRAPFPALAALGRRSLAVYVLHSFFIPALSALEHPWRGSAVFSIAAAPLLSVAICLVCVAAGWLIERAPVARTVLLGAR